MGGISCHGCVYVQKFVSEKNIQRLAHLDQGLLGHQQFLISAPSGSRLHNFLLMCRISSPFPLKRPKLSSKLLFQAGDFLFCCLLSFFFFGGDVSELGQRALVYRWQCSPNPTQKLPYCPATPLYLGKRYISHHYIKLYHRCNPRRPEQTPR